MNLQMYTAQGMGGYSPTAKATDNGMGNEYARIANTMMQMGEALAKERDADDITQAQVEYAKGVAALDDKYAQDEDFSTIKQRRAKDVEELSNSLMNGVSRNARNTLEGYFTKSNAQDSITFGGVVKRRDADLRVARFARNMDVLQNNLVMANDPIEIDMARKAIDVAYTNITPFMGHAQAIKSRDAVFDNVNFMRAQRQIPDAVRAGHKFDAKLFKSLNPAQVVQIERLYKTEEKRIKAENKSFIQSQLDDHYAVMRMEGRDDGLAQKASNLGLHDIANDIKINDKANMIVFHTSTINPGGSIISHYNAAMEQTNTILGGDANAAEREKVLSKLSTLRTNAVKEYQNDPYGAALQIEGAQLPDETDEAYVTRVMEREEALGMGIPGVGTKVMTVAQANELKVQYEEGDANAKSEIIIGIQTGYGKYAPIALSQLDLDDSSSLAAGIVQDDMSKYHLLKESIDLKDVKLTDIEPDKDKRKTVAYETEAILANNDAWKAIQNNINRFGNAAQRSWLSQQREYMQKVYASRGEKGVLEYFSNYHGVEGSKGSYLVPNTYSFRKVDSGLNKVLKNYDLSDYVGVEQDHPFYKEAVEDLKEYGTVVNASPAVVARNKQEGVMIMNTKTNAPYKDRQGNVLFFSFDELESKGEELFVGPDVKKAFSISWK